MNRRGLYTLIFEMVVLTAMIGCFISAVVPGYEGEYTAGLIDKVEKLENTLGPKIVLIGNSNLAFGINSKKIEEEMGMPVVNMGLHGGLGNAFSEEMAKINIEPGDIYVVCHTNYIDDSSTVDWALTWITVENKYKHWRLIRKQDMSHMIDAFPIYLKKCIELWAEGQSNQMRDDEYYYREVFNEYGDVAPKREGSRLDDLGIEFGEYCPGIDEACTERLNELTAYIEQKGAEMVVAGYPIIVDGSPSEGFLDDIEVFQIQLAEQLKCAVISDFREYCYDQKYFFDTIAHLNDEGVELRTEQLIRDLKAYRKGERHPQEE